MNPDSLLLTRYISVWGWHLTAMIFLASALVVFTSNKILMGSLLIVFIICEVVSYVRKRDMEIENTEEEEWDSGAL